MLHKSVKMSSRVQYFKCQGFGYDAKLNYYALVIKGQEVMGEEKDYDDYVYGPDLEDFHDLD